MMPNLNSYMDVVYSLNSDSYSTMGALSVDVPNFSAINSTFGFEYGRKVLQFIADTLLNIFGKNLYIPDMGRGICGPCAEYDKRSL